MKRPHWQITHLLLLLGLAAVSPAYAQMKDRMTESQLAEQSQTVNPIDKLAPLAAAAEGDPTKKVTSTNLMENSAKLSFNGRFTLVPSEALLHVPERLSDRTTLTKGSKFVSFNEFIYSNRGWVQTVEVTFDQARGHEAIDENVAASFKKSGRVIVAVLQGSPIAVLSPKSGTPTQTVK